MQELSFQPDVKVINIFRLAAENINLVFVFLKNCTSQWVCMQNKTNDSLSKDAKVFT